MVYLYYFNKGWNKNKILSFKQMKDIINTKYKLIKENDSKNDTTKVKI